MAEFFDKFPKIKYDLRTTGGRRSEFEFPMNILVRIGFYSETFNNIFFYYNYVIKDTDKPEILAEKYYKDPEAHWVILLSNKIIDPFYDWPLTANEFDKYIITSYGSIESAKTRIQRYEKIVKTVDATTSLETIRKYEITLPEYNTLPNSDPTGEQKVLPSGKVVTVYTYRNIVYSYDHEFEVNENKRNIKLIKAEYYPTIKLEFDDLMRRARAEVAPSGLTRRI
jgi:hypothetical protein